MAGCPLCSALCRRRRLPLAGPAVRKWGSATRPSRQGGGACTAACIRRPAVRVLPRPRRRVANATPPSSRERDSRTRARRNPRADVRGRSAVARLLPAQRGQVRAALRRQRHGSLSGGRRRDGRRVRAVGAPVGANQRVDVCGSVCGGDASRTPAQVCAVPRGAVPTRLCSCGADLRLLASRATSTSRRWRHVPRHRRDAPRRRGADLRQALRRFVLLFVLPSTATRYSRGRSPFRTSSIRARESP